MYKDAFVNDAAITPRRRQETAYRQSKQANRMLTVALAPKVPPFCLATMVPLCYSGDMKLDRTKLSTVPLKNDADIRYWAGRTPLERLRAIQLHRQIAYGRASTSRRLQRVLEIAERR